MSFYLNPFFLDKIHPENDKSLIEEFLSLYGNLKPEISKPDISSNDEIYIEFDMQNGNGKRRIKILSKENLQNLLSGDFGINKWSFIERYNAMYNLENGEIECLVQCLNREYLSKWENKVLKKEIKMNFSLILDDFFEMLNNDEKSISRKSKKDEIKKTLYINNAIISFQNPSSLLSSLIDRKYGGLLLKIKNISINNHDEAFYILRKLSNIAFFHIDYTTNISLNLEKDINDVHTENEIDEHLGDMLVTINYQYDEKPMAIYWRARTVYNLPILQYLAYYQIIEYYFNIYSKNETMTKIENILKIPDFNSNKVENIMKIIDEIEINKFRKELEILNLILEKCLNDEYITVELCKENGLREYFKKEKDNISKDTINFSEKPDLIRKQIANRIYGLRCRIVHVKDDFNSQKIAILPGSEEEKKLKNDLYLIKNISRMVLFCNAKTMQ
jgi:hypothetical protein